MKRFLPFLVRHSVAFLNRLSNGQHSFAESLLHAFHVQRHAAFAHVTAVRIVHGNAMARRPNDIAVRHISAAPAAADCDALQQRRLVEPHVAASRSRRPPLVGDQRPVNPQPGDGRAEVT